LKDEKIDTDAKTRNQSKTINKLMQPKVKRSSTMRATAKVIDKIPLDFYALMKNSLINSAFLIGRDGSVEKTTIKGQM
jgi:hypothetical protein